MAMQVCAQHSLFFLFFSGHSNVHSFHLLFGNVCVMFDTTDRRCAVPDVLQGINSLAQRKRSDM